MGVYSIVLVSTLLKYVWFSMWLLENGFVGTEEVFYRTHMCATTGSPKVMSLNIMSSSVEDYRIVFVPSALPLPPTTETRCYDSAATRCSGCTPLHRPRKAFGETRVPLYITYYLLVHYTYSVVDALKLVFENYFQRKTHRRRRRRVESATASIWYYYNTIVVLRCVVIF